MDHSNLFSHAHEAAVAPLAHRMRPRVLSEVVGQSQIIGDGKPLSKWVKNQTLPSLLFWGPPGCGKTTLAEVIARSVSFEYEKLSAVLSGVKDIKEAIDRARFRLPKKTLLFVDEIHRFNKSQQDALLPHVEAGLVTLIGATTENPSFSVNSALLSRLRVLRLTPLTHDELKSLIVTALEDRTRGLNGKLKLSPEVIDVLAENSDGDARRALTTLDSLSLAFGEKSANELTLDDVRDFLEKNPLSYDKKGEHHYDTISAFIKSMRASETDAAVYYLARMLESGEDPLFIARRMLIFASEDIGNADFRAFLVATAAVDAVKFLGMPESRINLSQAVIFLANAKKDRTAYNAIGKALDTVRETGTLPVPFHLRNAVTSLMKSEGYGVKNEGDSFLPDAIKGMKFLE